MIVDKTMENWHLQYPIIQDLQSLKEVLWINKNKLSMTVAKKSLGLTMEDMWDASDRLERFAAYIKTAFPETGPSGGILESPIKQIPVFQKWVEQEEGRPMQGKWWLKCDSHLPISGSVKARGGIYEVLHYAEELAMKEGGLKITDDYSVLAEERYVNLFSKYSIAVSSTGNLGLSIGIISAKLGFQVTVHMSADARRWKKQMLRSKGVTVIEYAEDYSKAVMEGRLQAENDPYCYFVDDENSKTLFLGYSVAALRLKEQLKENNIVINENHPLFVYLPCGVGGGPGGITFGLKQVFGDAVHCFFAEPTHSPCMLLGMATGYHNKVCVQDFGIDNKTVADGLAVGRASGFVGKVMEPVLSGCFTIQDKQLYRYLAKMADNEGICVEPSALAGVMGPVFLTSEDGKEYLEREMVADCMDRSVHLIWATGGNMVPEEDMRDYYETGKNLLMEGR